MKITDTIHAIRHPFRLLLGEGRYVERFVYSYLIVGKTICLVDAGVAATAPLILDTVKELGRPLRPAGLPVRTQSVSPSSKNAASGNRTHATAI